jgi:hypothetical protein
MPRIIAKPSCIIVVVGFFAMAIQTVEAQGLDKPWARHTIDDSSKGADGVRLADVNGDGLMDIATGWEEGGVVRAYLHPGLGKVKQPWPKVTVGKVKSAEDAVFADLDGDGAVDVVSCCEGGTKCVFVHWAPRNKADYLNASKWKTQAIPWTKGKSRWMFALPMQIDGKGGIDLVVGSKNPGGVVGWLRSPEKNPRDLSAWTFHKLESASWIMSLIGADIDGDGDKDIVVSDRKGPKRGAYWLENPGAAIARLGKPWKRHEVGGHNKEVMFLDVVDFDGDKAMDVLAAVKKTDVLFMRNPGKGGFGGGGASEGASGGWKSYSIALPPKIGTSKSVRAGDIDLDGKMDLVFSCEHANPPLSGMMWMSYKKSVTDPKWVAHPMSGPRGLKYDRIELLDLDGDGDLDAMCCEERDLNAIFWYENPTR